MYIRFVPVQCAVCGRIFELDEFDVSAATKRPDGRPYVHCLVCLRIGSAPEKSPTRAPQRRTA